MNASPLFEFVMTQLSIVTFRTAFMFPSQNLIALEADESRQLVTVIFSHGRAGPYQFIE
jgi:hypothetical protein